MKKEYQFGSFGQGKMFVEIKDGYLTIRRKGLTQILNQGLKGDKSININSITAVQVKKPGITTGYLQFILMGSQESKGGVWSAISDENTVLIANKKQYEKALEIKEYIEKYNNKPKTQQVQEFNSSVADELKKLKELLDDGILTQEEFDEQKRKILSK